ncbi:hypothetical protein [Mesorhizobium sp. KR1-2]|uniref:hypothetical protein n=1 Tax=Mesorhizobium sp. KR1-2 TaxID=3156609 RepID=UPI0032B62007
MTAAVVALSSPAIVFPSNRVRDFIELARDQIDALIPTEEWPSDVWHVGRHFITKGQNRDNRVLAFYNSSSTLSSRQEVEGEPLDPAFKEFAKAYVRYMHSTSPVAFENTTKRLDALQFMEAAFRKLGLHPAIESLNHVVLNMAVELAQAGVGPARHYQFAIYIQQVHRFCMDRKFLNGPFQWKHGVRKPKDRTEEIGNKAKQWREEKLPSPEAYDALAHIFRNAESFIDRLYSSVCAICISIPIRAHEVLQLRLDCEVHGRAKSPETGEDVETYGIRVWPGKGNPPHVKWVPSQMASAVKEAVQRLREMCSEARQVAAWYELHPDRLWLPTELETYRQSDFLALTDLQTIIAMQSIKGLAHWVRKAGVDWRSDSSSSNYLREVRISSLAEVLVSRLPSDFPEFNKIAEQLYSQTLILLAYNQGHADKATYRCLVEKATVQSFEHWLSGHDGGRKPSVC